MDNFISTAVPFDTLVLLRQIQSMTRTPTLILDGIWAKRGRFDRLRQLLESQCGPTEVFDYNTSGFVPFETLAAQLCKHLHNYNEPVNVLGFSMGGIVIRTAHLLDPSIPIRRAVFLNTPHAGSIMSYIFPLPGTRQLQPTSHLMKQLAADDWPIPTLATWSPFDPIVVPGRSAKWPKATEQIRCAPCLHNWPIWSGEIHHKIANFLVQPALASHPDATEWRSAPQFSLSTQNSALRT